MTTERLPHQRLLAYEVAIEMLGAVNRANIADAALRTQALRAAKSVCLNVAEAAGRSGRADRARVFSIARGEACEAAAAVEIAGVTGDASSSDVAATAALAHRLVGLL